MNYEQMSVEELTGELHRLNEERGKLRQQAMAVHAVLDRKQATETAQRKLAEMSDVEKAALAQLIQAQGIESAEVVDGLRK